MTNEEVHQELKAIHTVLAKIETAHAVQISACQGHFLRTANLETTVFGDGRDGLKDQVGALIVRLETEGKVRNETWKDKVQMWGTVIAATSAFFTAMGVVTMILTR